MSFSQTPRFDYRTRHGLPVETNHKYGAVAHWTTARNGMAEAETVRQPLCFSAPPEFGGESNRWTPEHFFVAAVGSCFVTTFRVIAELSELDVSSLEVAGSPLFSRPHAQR